MYWKFAPFGDFYLYSNCQESRRPSPFDGRALSPSPDPSSSSISTQPSSKDEDLGSSLEERKIELNFILSSARWSPATVEILAAVRRILSRKYWAGGSAGPISGGQKAQSTTHKASQKIFPTPLSSSPKGFKPSLEPCTSCRTGYDINNSMRWKVRFLESDWEKRSAVRCTIKYISIICNNIGPSPR